MAYTFFKSWGFTMAVGSVSGAFYRARYDKPCDTDCNDHHLCNRGTFEDSTISAFRGAVCGAFIFGPVLPFATIAKIASINKN
jgi:hypothetical protein